MTFVKVTCTCGHKLKARAEHIGKQAPCPKCGRLLQIVPVSAAALPPLAEPSAYQVKPPSHVRNRFAVADVIVIFYGLVFSLTCFGIVYILFRPSSITKVGAVLFGAFFGALGIIAVGFLGAQIRRWVAGETFCGKFYDSPRTAATSMGLLRGPIICLLPLLFFGTCVASVYRYAQVQKTYRALIDNAGQFANIDGGRLKHHSKVANFVGPYTRGKIVFIDADTESVDLDLQAALPASQRAITPEQVQTVVLVHHTEHQSGIYYEKRETGNGSVSFSNGTPAISHRWLLFIIDLPDGVIVFDEAVAGSDPPTETRRPWGTGAADRPTEAILRFVSNLPP
jgi:hypothetical protein